MRGCTTPSGVRETPVYRVLRRSPVGPCPRRAKPLFELIQQLGRRQSLECHCCYFQPACSIITEWHDSPAGTSA
jgi:hypothetical protein